MTYRERINLNPSTMTPAERQEHAETLRVYAYEGENLADETVSMAETALTALTAAYPEEFAVPSEEEQVAGFRARWAAKGRKFVVRNKGGSDA